MPKQLLDRSNVLASFKQMRGKRMTKAVRSRGFGNARFKNGSTDRTLDTGFVKVMTAVLLGFSVKVGTGGWEDPLPTPLLGSAG